MKNSHIITAGNISITVRSYNAKKLTLFIFAAMLVYIHNKRIQITNYLLTRVDNLIFLSESFFVNMFLLSLIRLQTIEIKLKQSYVSSVFSVSIIE